MILICLSTTYSSYVIIVIEKPGQILPAERPRLLVFLFSDFFGADLRGFHLTATRTYDSECRTD